MPEISLPLWLRLLLGVIPSKLMPPWLKEIIPVLYAIIQALPKDTLSDLKTSLRSATAQSKNTKDPIPLVDEIANQAQRVRRHCDGLGCPTDTVT